jgi:peroxiredoxin Q/BCP
MAAIAMAWLPSIASAQGPETGSKIDEFSLQDQSGTSHKLSELLEEGPLAVVFFRSADW